MVGREWPDLAASIGLSWAVFLLTLADQPLSVEPTRLQRVGALFLCAGAVVGARLLGPLADSDHVWRGHVVAGASFARAMPLLFGICLLLWLKPLRELRAAPLLALACPLVTPVPGWLRTTFDPSAFSAWGTQQLLSLAGFAATRQGKTLALPGDQFLEVQSECSGLGAVLLLLALLVLLGQVSRTAGKRVAAMVPLAVGLGLLSNWVRLAMLGAFLARGEVDRFDFWHDGRGAHLYPATSALLLLIVTVPLLFHRPHWAGGLKISR